MDDRPIHFVGSSKDDICDFPAEVRSQVGHALRIAQQGAKVEYAKPLKGINPKTIEVVEDFDRDTYRAVYTVKLAPAVYVLHAFKKKSKSGRKTPQPDIDLIKTRLKIAVEHHRQTYEGEMK